MTLARDVKNTLEGRIVGSLLLYMNWSIHNVPCFILHQLNSGNLSNEEELMVACHLGNLDILYKLSSAKVDPKIPNENGWTALHGACRYDV